ncbi:16S rRNA (uracil(1498)-N(3))-methyltransferase [Mycoplasma sp. ES3157-GEN-MYC]|uniref:Ribosomal RNA small subunit methyltransferase E n=1 Tax=Mycoplasma miroungigenitalium TaxID=754515 RepID=A0A6M4J9Y0_9MOLU|nr:16S rRNA (uracil(1498)-N(3))-methyltransferase [Mycoplasma miroungigenitalium]MBU4690683.1 16S rRNA (uracil(1498)-N(3))-methyltransferase [Mycoplasma miroungigenitalium]MBU4691952.1 16S rRNA (uracil(1498)-N(3))-methyltransferase [Mycoplasma miroungigenitalium]QJR43804.1 16S rRNA (uracil(1498)-N(3))-methyltransferase [Mycoplasma miroungigenitalium]
MHRFFVNEKIGNTFKLDDQTLHHIKVARLSKDNFLINFQGEFYECQLETDTNLARIIRKININHEFNNNLILAAPIIKPERFEWMLEKSVELGVKKIIPMISQYCNHKLIDSSFSDKKYIRYQTKIKEAAQQSFRNIIPDITKPQKLEHIVNEYLNQNYTIYIALETLDNSLQTNFLVTNSVMIAGPEGGFKENEIEFIMKIASTNENIKLISLGARILRAETAAITMLAKVKE